MYFSKYLSFSEKSIEPFGFVSLAGTLMCTVLCGYIQWYHWDMVREVKLNPNRGASIEKILSKTKLLTDR